MGVGAGLHMCDLVKKFTFAISSPDEFLYKIRNTFYVTRICPMLFAFHPIYHNTKHKIAAYGTMLIYLWYNGQLPIRSRTVKSHTRSQVTVPICSPWAVSYLTSTDTIIVYVTVFEINVRTLKFNKQCKGTIVTEDKQLKSFWVWILILMTYAEVTLHDELWWPLITYGVSHIPLICHLTHR